MKSLLFIFVLLTCTRLGLAQEAVTRSRTEIRLEELRMEIAQEERLLDDARSQEKVNQNRLSYLNRQLTLRESLVRNYSARIEQLVYERDSLGISIERLDSELSALKTEYGARATHAYKYGRQHDAALILSASSINQMLVRISYLRRYTNKRREQLSGINIKTVDLREKRAEMQRKLVESEIMLVTAAQEQEKLDDLRGVVRREISRIRSKKETYSESLAEKRSAEQQLVDLIQSYLIAESRRISPRNSAASIAELSRSFSAARGLLRWPANGAVVEPFGDIVHPEYGTRTPNPGILIETSPSAEVKAVFSGHVSTIDIIPDMGRFAIIEHGEYHTVYGNLSLFYVSEGDEISAGQLIGRSGTEAEPRGNAIFFAVFRNGIPQDPATWLSGQ